MRSDVIMWKISPVVVSQLLPPAQTSGRGVQFLERAAFGDIIKSCRVKPRVLLRHFCLFQ